MLACFYPRVQLDQLRALGVRSDHLYCRFPLIWESSVLVLVRQDLPCGLQHCHEGPNVRASSFFFPDGLSPARCEVCPRLASLSRFRSLLVVRRRLEVPTRDSSCVVSGSCIWATKSVTSTSVSPFASPSPARCCFFGTSLNEVPLFLGTFVLPLNCAFLVCCSFKVARTSLVDVFGPSLELGKQARLLGDSNVYKIGT